MKRVFVLIGLLFGMSTGVGAAQTVGVSLRFGDPHFAGQIVIGRPYYARYARPYYYRYRPAPVIVVGRRYYRGPRVVVVRPYRYHSRRWHRGW